MKNLKINKRIFIIISLVTLLLTGISSFTNSYGSAEAYGACPSVGSFMGREEVSDGNLDSANAEIGNKKWTVEELFRKSVAYSSFYGEGEGTWFHSEKKNRGESLEGWNSDIQKRLEESRSFSCMFGKFDGVPQLFLSMASGITAITGTFVSNFLGKDFMAETFTKIIGGDGSSDGLIGTFLNSFYLPLVVLAVLIMVITIVYKGLIQMKMREALNSMIWTVMAFIIGVTLMLSPQLLASAPQAITSTITSCVLGALSGQNCLSDNVETPTVLAANECVSTVGGTNGNSSESIMNSLNCTIWKSFVLEPWAEEQFGEPYKNLYTSNAPPGGQIWKNLPEGQGNKYCLSLTSSKSYKDSVSGSNVPVMDLNENTVCNVALYHLFIKTEMKDSVFQSGNSYGESGILLSDDTGVYDSRWYDIIIPMASDESKWRNWAGEAQFGSRLASSIMSVIAVTAAATVLFTLAIFGGAYKLIGLILMAFAPIFLLFAIEPTKGRKIFLGWLETMVSSFLKYFAITVLIVVSLVMYSGLLSNTSGPASLIGVIVLTVALHMYRKEIVDLIGASNMGGERLSNKAGKLADKIKEKGKTFAGGALGGASGTLAARKDRMKARDATISDLQEKLSKATTEEEKDFYTKEIEEEKKAQDEEGSALGTAVTGTVKGGADSFKRSMKRGNGLAANVFQQSGRTADDIKRKDEKDRENAEKERAQYVSSLASPQLPDINDVEENDSVVTTDEMTPSEVQRNTAMSALVDNQRKPVEYKGDLSEEEKVALNEFAEKLKESTTDTDLAALAENPDILQDENKKQLVANELNARLEANTMVGIASNELTRTSLTDKSLVSDEELKLNLQVHAENYLETGDEAELQNHLDTRAELSQRTNIEFDSTKAEERLREYKGKVGDNYQRKEGIPTNEELATENIVEVKLNENEFVNLSNVTAPETMSEKIEEQKEKITEVRSLNETISQEKEERQNQNKNSQQEPPRSDSTNQSQGPTSPNQSQEPVGNSGPTSPNQSQGPVGNSGPTSPNQSQEPVGNSGPTSPNKSQEPVGNSGPTSPNKSQEPVGNSGPTSPNKSQEPTSPNQENVDKPGPASPNPSQTQERLNNHEQQSQSQEPPRSDSNQSQGPTSPNRETVDKPGPPSPNPSQTQERLNNQEQQSTPKETVDNSSQPQRQSKQQDLPKNETSKPQAPIDSQQNSKPAKPTNDEQQKNSFEELLKEVNTIDENPKEQEPIKPQDSPDPFEELLNGSASIDDLLDEMLKDDKDNK